MMLKRPAPALKRGVARNTLRVVWGLAVILAQPEKKISENIAKSTGSAPQDLNNFKKKKKNETP